MKQDPRSRFIRKKAKTVLRLPDLEFAKSAVLNSLTSPDAQRGYRHAIDEFVEWYCSEPRLVFNRVVLLRYRSYLETRQLASGTINLRLALICRNEPTITCKHDRLRPRPYAEFVEEIRGMIANRLLTYRQTLCDIGVAQPFGHQREHLALAD
jgi:hypothetical protein